MSVSAKKSLKLKRKDERLEIIYVFSWKRAIQLIHWYQRSRLKCTIIFSKVFLMLRKNDSHICLHEWKVLLIAWSWKQRWRISNIIIFLNDYLIVLQYVLMCTCNSISLKSSQSIFSVLGLNFLTLNLQHLLNTLIITQSILE